MPKLIIRLVTLMLVPWLVVDPVLSVGPTAHHAVIDRSDCFQKQALNAMAVLVRKYLGNPSDNARIQFAISPIPRQNEVAAAITIGMTPLFYGFDGGHPLVRLIGWTVFGSVMAFMAWSLIRGFIDRRIYAAYIKSLTVEQKKALNLSQYFHILSIELQYRRDLEERLKGWKQTNLEAQEREREAEEQLRIKLQWKGNAEAGERAMEDLKKIRDNFVGKLGPPSLVPDIVTVIKQNVRNHPDVNLEDAHYLLTGQRAPSRHYDEAELLTTAKILHVIFRHYAEFPESMEHSLGEHEPFRIRARQILGLQRDKGGAFTRMGPRTDALEQMRVALGARHDEFVATSEQHRFHTDRSGQRYKAMFARMPPEFFAYQLETLDQDQKPYLLIVFNRIWDEHVLPVVYEDEVIFHELREYAWIKRLLKEFPMGIIDVDGISITVQHAAHIMAWAEQIEAYPNSSLRRFDFQMMRSPEERRAVVEGLPEARSRLHHPVLRLAVRLGSSIDVERVLREERSFWEFAKGVVEEETRPRIVPQDVVSPQAPLVPGKIPSVDMADYEATPIGEGAFSTVYRDHRHHFVVKKFRDASIQDRHVQALIELNQSMKHGGNPELSDALEEMQAVRFSDGSLGIRMRWIDGPPVERVYRRLDAHRGWQFPEEDASRSLRRRAKSILNAIDDHAGYPLADRTYNEDLDDDKLVETLDNLLYVDGQNRVVDIDPIDMGRLKQWIARKRLQPLFQQFDSLDPVFDYFWEWMKFLNLLAPLEARMAGKSSAADLLIESGDLLGQRRYLTIMFEGKLARLVHALKLWNLLKAEKWVRANLVLKIQSISGYRNYDETFPLTGAALSQAVTDVQNVRNLLAVAA